MGLWRLYRLFCNKFCFKLKKRSNSVGEIYNFVLRLIIIYNSIIIRIRIELI